MIASEISEKITTSQLSKKYILLNFDNSAPPTNTHLSLLPCV